MLLQKENSLWLIVVVICGAILPNSLKNRHLEKGMNYVKIQLLSQWQRMQMQGFVQQGLACR